MTTGPTNKDRAETAHYITIMYAKLNRSGVSPRLWAWLLRLGRPGYRRSPSNRIADLLGSLYALCEREGYEFEALALSGKRGYLAEHVEKAMDI